jgi:S1-C subfamily serine protease
VFYISYTGKDGQAGELKLLGLDVVRDLALLGAEQRVGEPIRMSPLPPRGAPIFAMGNPLDLGLSIAVGTNGGILNQTDDSRILFSGSLNPGMSGGPTFNDQGEAIGINVATARNDISFIVPSRFLTDLIEQSASGEFASAEDLKLEVARPASGERLAGAGPAPVQFTRRCFPDRTLLGQQRQARRHRALQALPDSLRQQESCLSRRRQQVCRRPDL